MRPDLNKIDKTWTLFLDRDGVMNKEDVGKYILKWEEFIFYDGVLAAIDNLSKKFGKIIIVTNQRGVGKGLMLENTVVEIHNNMQKEIENYGGRVDAIYYCTDVDDACLYRKPNTGMALQALKDFPEIEFSKSIMVGNKPADMTFGRNAGMFTVFITSTNPHQVFPHPDIDFKFTSLSEFSKALQS
jgi:histidinol-phosphate phosphatase family protein